MSVLLTGGTGFIGNHIIHELLAKDYSVIATTRTLKKADALKNKFNNPKLTTFVVGDSMREDVYVELFKAHGRDIAHVIHTAFPITTQSTDFHRDIIEPAQSDMKHLLSNIKLYGSTSVKNIVLTSGIFVMMDMSKVGEKGLKYNEESWCPNSEEYIQQNILCALGVAKKRAEEMGWEFYRECRKTSKINFTSILPSYVFGPQMFDEDVHEHLNLSNEVINQIMHATTLDDIVPLQSEFIHVKDIAKTHVLALEREDLTGHRLVLSAGSFNQQDILNHLNQDFPSLKGKIPLGDPGKGAETHQDDTRILDNTTTVKLLGVPLKTLKDCVDDTAAQILRVHNKNLQ